MSTGVQLELDEPVSFYRRSEAETGPVEVDEFGPSVGVEDRVRSNDSRRCRILIEVADEVRPARCFAALIRIVGHVFMMAGMSGSVEQGFEGLRSLPDPTSIHEPRTVRLEITQRADLAVRALVLLQRSPSRLKSADLAVALGTTAGFVPHVMGPLVRAGWFRSVPGPTGDYEPVVVLDALSVLEIVEEVDGPTERGRCVVADRACDAAAPCAHHVVWGRARRELVASLAGLSLAAVSVTA